MLSAEGIELMACFPRITEPAIRRKIVELVRVVARRDLSRGSGRGDFLAVRLAVHRRAQGSEQRLRLDRLGHVAVHAGGQVLVSGSCIVEGATALGYARLTVFYLEPKMIICGGGFQQ